MTLLREFSLPSGRSGQQVQISDVVLVLDDGSCKLAVVEGLVKGNDGIVCSAIINYANRMASPTDLF